jgi:hypothetical protein
MRSRIIAFASIALFIASVASADPRPFTFTYDTYPVGKGNAEFEQWVTWKHHTEDEPGFTLFEFREEFEFGLADNFDLAFYLPNWRYEDSDERTGTKFDSVGVEAIVYLSNPVTDFLGSGLYAEFNVGEHELEFEQKLLLQKDVGNWIFAYNFIVETEIEDIAEADEEAEVEGELASTLGASYAFGNGKFRAGGEMLAEAGFEDWRDYTHTTVYAGPVFSYWSGRNLWVTVTPMFQLTDTEDEPDYNVRMIAGWEF